ncbi:cytochrome P450 [Auriscalpium vulgare]|uniref:Cytochrome P450 n=1 Tax=Auriscalpium vulgare TaxID=40419 RepID=A0ACB8RH46_9AGAM|nr:cytochrome P450 [Auriscalpium vulgare]
MAISFADVVLAGEILLLTGAGLVVFSILRHRVKQLSLWKIPGPPSRSLWSGNIRQIFHANAWSYQEELFQQYGSVLRTTGLLGDIRLLVSDPVACTTILLKEQDIFEETPWFTETNRHAFGPSLLSATGAAHRKQRKMLNPVFSIKHMRHLIPLFQNLTAELRDILYARTEDGTTDLNMADWFSRLALELIAQGGLGHTFNTMNADGKGGEFSRAVKEFSPSLSKVAPWRPLFPLISTIIPPKILRFGAMCLPWPDLHNLIRISDEIHANASAIFEKKKALLNEGDAAFMDQIGEGKDIITILLKANLNASEQDRLPDEQILSQMSMLLFAATDTTSGAISRIMQTLADRQDIQEKLREELTEAQDKAGGRLGYDELTYGLPYLDAVCREILRIHPPVPLVQRMCQADTTIPVSTPIQTVDGPIKSIYVPKKTTVMVNVRAINRDPSIWGPDAAELKPERWLSPLPETVTQARIPGVYSNTLTFFGGGHACIGFKFAQLEMKVVLAELIPHFRFYPDKKQEVFWRFGGIITPGVRGSTVVGPQMPLIVERV